MRCFAFVFVFSRETDSDLAKIVSVIAVTHKKSEAGTGRRNVRVLLVFILGFMGRGDGLSRRLGSKQFIVTGLFALGYCSVFCRLGDNIL